MRTLVRYFAVMFCLGAAPLVMAQQAPTWEIESLAGQGAVEYDLNTGMVTATNGVVVRYGGGILSAGQVSVNQNSGEVIAWDKVRIQQGDLIWAGDQVRYNFKTRQMEAQQFRAGKPPVFIGGDGLHAQKTTNGVYSATNALVTADDISSPLIKLRAKSVIIRPGKRVEARSATLYAGSVPVFYFPYYSRSLAGEGNHFNFVPGYRSRFGAYMLTGYHWELNEQLDGEFHMDYRTRRGAGVGPDFNYHLGEWGDGSIKYYYARDENPGLDKNLSFTTPPSDRQRVDASYLAIPSTNLNARARVRYQTDPGVVREFYEGDYRKNAQPSTFVEVNKFWSNFSLDFYAQPRVNDFLDTVERLPEVRLTGFRQEIGETPLYYESESSAGWYRQLYGETNDLLVLPAYSAARADTYHQVLLPWSFFGWLNVTPRVGGRFTYYAQSQGPGAYTDEEYRGVFNTGAEVSTKLSRLWAGAHSSFLEADGFRHILEPSVNYVYVPRPNVTPTQLPAFDTVLPSLRLLPIDYPDYNAIDSIDSQNVTRFGLRNKIQTKRDGKVVNLAYWDVYTDWRLRPDANQTTFADVYSDLVLKPRRWLTVESLTRHDIDAGSFPMSLTTATIEPNDRFAWTVGQFYLRQDNSTLPTSTGEGQNLFLNSLLYRLNENWAFRATHHFDARTGRMQEQYYSIYRDFRSWTGALTVRLREGIGQPDDFTVGFTFSLKAFPKYGVGRDAPRPYYLLGS